MARRVEAFGRVRRGGMSRMAAAGVLGMSERHFRRLYDAYEEGGPDAILDRRRGRPAKNKAPPDVVDWVEAQYRTHYFDFNAKHFHAALRRDHPTFRYGYTWTKSVLYSRGCLKPSKLRGPHRKERKRSEAEGMIIFQDGSTHDWFQGRRGPCDLIVTLDDATSQILSAFFVEQEGTASSFRGLHETIEKQGLFSAFYTDRGGHYFYTPKAGEPVDKGRLTQVGRALLQLGITHIPSYEPQGRGRMERVFGTLQGRLPQEMRRAGLSDIDAANTWLKDHYIAAHNSEFGRPAESPETHFIPYRGDLANVLCHQEERVVDNQNCVQFQGRKLQIPATPQRAHYVAARVRVHEYQDGGLAIFHGPREIARFGGDHHERSQVPPAPAAKSTAGCSRPSRPSPAGGAHAPALTAAARPAPTEKQAGTKKRPRPQPNKETDHAAA